MSKRISRAFTLTERKEYHTLREKSRFAGVKRFAYGCSVMGRLRAKDDVDNVGAGRAAKGVNPSLRAKRNVIRIELRSFFMQSLRRAIVARLLYL